MRSTGFAALALVVATGCGGEKVVFKAEIAADSGIESGDEVYVGDERIGEVKRIEQGEHSFREPDDIITMELEEEATPELPVDTTVTAFGAAGRVRIDPGDRARLLPPGSTIRIEYTEVCAEDREGEC